MRTYLLRRTLFLLLCTGAFTEALAAVGSWHVPHPWRADAAVDGRRIDYGDERFLHLFSYDHQVDRPGPVDQGLRGTAGSVDSDTLYYDFRFLRHFQFDNPATAATLDVQRSEDFDGAYDRQLIGLRHAPTEHWALSLQGDVLAEKAGSDVYFGVDRLLANDGWLRAQWLVPDAYFNDKTVTASSFRDRAHTLFLQWHQPREGGHTTLSVNLSPWSVFDDRTQGVLVSSRQTRVGLQHWQTVGAMQWRLSVNGEQTRRHHRLDEDPLRLTFKRDFAEATTSLHFNQLDGRPWLGVRYLWLHERGWFGRAINDSGEVKRKEPLGFAGFHVPVSETSYLGPTVYLSRARVEQTQSGDWSARDEDQWIGKLSLPWHITVRRENGAIITVSPSFRLHRFAFGGGNIQLHWPL